VIADACESCERFDRSVYLANSLVESFSLIELPLPEIEFRKVVEAGGGKWMIRTQSPLKDVESTLEKLTRPSHPQSGFSDHRSRSRGLDKFRRLVLLGIFHCRTNH
jgi:hypothetical protein